MEVFAVTVFVSFAFAVLFAALFLGERAQHQSRSLEQDSLLPLEDSETLKPAPVPVPVSLRANPSDSVPLI